MNDLERLIFSRLKAEKADKVKVTPNITETIARDGELVGVGDCEFFCNDDDLKRLIENPSVNWEAN